MTLIFNQIDRITGIDRDDVTAEISLSWDKNDSPIIKNDSGEVVFYGNFKTSCDEDGRWQAEVLPNSDLTPTSVYKIVESANKVVLGEYFIEVLDQATPTDTWVGDLLVDKPVWEV